VPNQRVRLFDAGEVMGLKKWLIIMTGLKDLSLLDVLRDLCVKVFNVNTMLAKRIVASRLETGISFNRNSTYQILQSMDFFTLVPT